MEYAFLSYTLKGFTNAVHPINLLIIILGLTWGIIGGMLPGISVVTAIALAMPFTFTMETNVALIALGAIFAGATYGGANAAILLNTPGQPGSFATTLDGYSMTKHGQADEALFSALIGSCVGGVIGTIMLLCFFGPLSKIALQFGPPEFFWLAIFGLTTLAAMSPENVLKGLLGGGIGLLISTVGLDPLTSTPRFTFGYYPLVQGFDMVVVMIGIFSFSQMMVVLEMKEGYIADYTSTPQVATRVLKKFWRDCKRLIFQSSIIGTFVGTLPGAGGSVASIIAYNEAKRWDKNPARYGTGIMEGVAAPECANNACVGGALVPMMSLGIPGNASAAVLMGGLMAQGLIPGPTLLERNPDVAYNFITGLIIVNIAMFFVGAIIIRGSARILNVPIKFIVPTVIALAVIGSYSLRNSELDVVVMLISGVVAYLLMKVGIYPAPIALGVVLGPIAENAFALSLVLAKAKGSVLDVLVFQPIPFVLIFLCIVVLFAPLLLNKLKRF